MVSVHKQENGAEVKDVQETPRKDNNNIHNSFYIKILTGTTLRNSQSSQAYC